MNDQYILKDFGQITGTRAARGCLVAWSPKVHLPGAELRHHVRTRGASREGRVWERVQREAGGTGALVAFKMISPEKFQHGGRRIFFPKSRSSAVCITYTSSSCRDVVMTGPTCCCCTITWKMEAWRGYSFAKNLTPSSLLLLLLPLTQNSPFGITVLRHRPEPGRRGMEHEVQNCEHDCRRALPLTRRVR